MNNQKTILYRPVGPEELALIAASGYREFPPRLGEQPIFYPVLNEEYARQIARDWNAKDSGVGYVTRFAVRGEFLAKHPVQTVGSAIHRELWIPAANLAEMNRNIVGVIEVIATYPPEKATRWFIKHKNILDEPADVLICSANVNLQLTGGVGAELYSRYGGGMQAGLTNCLQSRSPHTAERGEIFPYAGPEMPYRSVLNAVAIDGWYHSSPEVITDIVRRALYLAAGLDARTVALVALATGYGDLTIADFGIGIRPLMAEAFSPVLEVVICLLLDFEVNQLSACLPDASVVKNTIGSPE